jgi:tetratricopeptide (TPR) repeat protein
MAEARKAGAVALFEARARAADTRFALAEPNVAAVTEICRRLDGIALAIELAAARVPLLGVDGLRLRLDERFRILTGGARLALPRHQTLRAALDWSHGLLTQAEQILFRRLGAFLGSFGLESAQRVAAGTDLDEWAVLDQLGGLVDKSLVVADSGAAPRYRLLETSRAFALEKLREAQESEAIMRRHAEALLAVFEESLEAEYVLSTQARLERYLPDLDNARAALDWSAGTSGDPQLHIALAGAIGWIWFDAELRPEGLRRTQAAIATIGPSTPPHLEARLLASWPLLAHPIVGARELAALARAIEIYRQLGDRRPLFAALSRQVKYLLYRDRREEAELSLQEAERLFDADWPPAIRSELLFALGTLRDTQGRFEEGIAAHEEILRRATTLNNNGLALKALINLEQGEAALGRLESSVARGRAMIRLMREDRSLRSGNEHFVLKNLHMSLVRLGAIDEALEVMRALHPVLERVGRTYELMEPCALLALKRGRPDDGARLLGYADLDFSTNDIGRDPVEQLLRESLVQGLRDALPAAELSRLLEEGEGLSDEDALRLALRE